MRRLLVASVVLATLLPAALRAGDPDARAARPASSPSLPTATPGPGRGVRPASPVTSPVASPVASPRSAGAPTVERPVTAPVTTGRTGFPDATPRLRRPVRTDSITVEKGLRRLTLWQGAVPLRTYDVALGMSPVGPKLHAGDNRTPEGLYHIDARNPSSRFHLALHVSYPNDADRARARALGVNPGGDIMIHGLPNGQGNVGRGHRSDDWTNGCVAVTDDEIEEIFASVAVGTPIRIMP
jgi:lipoprotein-anchoring transpeptidase ErfK/SrfK